LRNFPKILDELIEHYANKSDQGSKGLTGNLKNQRERAGGPDSIGVLNKADIFEPGGNDLVQSVMQIVGNRARHGFHATRRSKL
jgi:hypothetical protein